jgi:DNA-binding transcriptional LysR family regulator
MRTTLSIAVRHDHPLADAALVSSADLADENLVMYAADEDDVSVLDRLGAEQRARVHRVTGTLGALVLASAGAGVAVVPTATERVGLPDLVYRPLRDMAV